MYLCQCLTKDRQVGRDGGRERGGGWQREREEEREKERDEREREGGGRQAAYFTCDVKSSHD